MWYINFRRRGKRLPQITFQFLVGDQIIALTNVNILVNKPWDMAESVKQAVTSAIRSLNRIISVSRSAGGFPHSAFTKLFQSLVISVEYSAAICMVIHVPQ